MTNKLKETIDANKLKEIINAEVKMTMGCTDPGAVAYAAAKAASLLEGEISCIEIVLSKNLYKNALYVGIPVIKRNGIGYAALLGVLVRNAERKLEVLDEVDEKITGRFEKELERVDISVSYGDFGDPLYISVKCISGGSNAQVIIKGDYDHIYRVFRDGKLIYENSRVPAAKDMLKVNCSFKDIYECVTNARADEFMYLLEYEAINKRAALMELSNDPKFKIMGGINSGAKDVARAAELARMYVYGASKLRMRGEKVPIVSVAGSGNLGIASMLTVSAVSDMLGIEDGLKAKALALSILLTIYIKSRMNRLTVMCGAAVAAAAGAGAAVNYILGGGFEQAQNAVNTVIGSIGGMFCDGAKESCAFKAAFSAENAVISAYMALEDKYVPRGVGIICHDIDRTVDNLAQINDIGMKEVDNMMLNIIQKHVLAEKVAKLY